MTTPALEVAHLSKRFGGLPATKDVSLRVMPGERRLIIGPNGAGKTTLFNLVTGDLTADAGSVRLFGQELMGMPTQQRVHLGLARTYQILTLFPRERLVHNVVLSLLGLDRRRWNPWSILTANRDLYANAQASLEPAPLAIGGLDHDPFGGLAEPDPLERRLCIGIEVAVGGQDRPRVPAPPVEPEQREHHVVNEPLARK